MISHLERLALSEQIASPKPRIRAHHIVCVSFFVLPVWHVAERIIHFIETPAEFIWVAKVIFFREL